MRFLIVAALFFTSPAWAEEGDLEAFFAREYAAEIANGKMLLGRAFPIDGDSLILKTKGGDVEVRLFGISAPEWDAPFGPYATRLLHSAAYNQVTRCFPLGKDRYKRTVARCLSGVTDLGSRMLQFGGATVYRKYVMDLPIEQQKVMFRLEADACQEKYGIWSNPPKPTVAHCIEPPE